VSEATPKIDFCRIVFPTDTVTVGSLRAKFPSAIEKHDPDFEPDFFNVIAAMDGERRLAQLAFDAVLGVDHSQDNPLEGTRSDVTRELLESYPVLGIASGPKHARELIRKIETEATAQAQEYVGKKL
jgi:hypothetical protein